MANYRRCYVSGGCYFFTLATERRAPILANDTARDTLRSAIRSCQRQWPFTVNALVLLPDHLHAIWTLPPGDADYSKRWGLIKKDFSPVGYAPRTFRLFHHNNPKTVRDAYPTLAWQLG